MHSARLAPLASVPLAAVAHRYRSQTTCHAQQASPKAEDGLTPPRVIPSTVKELKIYEPLHLNMLGFSSIGLPNNMAGLDAKRKSASGQIYSKFIGENDCVVMDAVMSSSSDQKEAAALPRAGPRKELHFDPKEVRAAIVTCGGLCPGLNDIIHHIVEVLSYTYGVEIIFGIRGGYRGLARGPVRVALEEHYSMITIADKFGLTVTSVAHSSEDHFAPIILTPENVHSIQHDGGSMLGCSRGGFDIEKIIAFLKVNKINMLFIVGGDGTHRGAFKISQECAARGLNVSVAGVPKTIDNDMAIIDQSFGFQSAVEAAQIAIKTAKTEAAGNMPNGVGVVKLMGRSAGFIAAYATLGSGDVDLCLIPEIPLVLDGENGCLPYLERVIAQKGHALVVVAEGAGEDVLGQSAEVDAGGNRKLPKIGEFMVKKITDHFNTKGLEATVKYIDPSYIIRSVSANSRDSYECFVLSQGAVHGCMAGYTGFTVGMVNAHTVMIPIPLLVRDSPRTMNPKGRTWERVLMNTGQPNTVLPPVHKKRLTSKTSSQMGT
eukprot:gnl/MRDRNA2_/MRDRNA2_75462_c0_seq1.p1 gnl/MRDRNA2_/MRDRNA2_75462_c0~~gnl/MRDRNA2_/MRDRNA2_75462_c0_seq1.p1  ORF type:complete len:546 (-),score=93.55 gnl/MRDRNA2_/MRDRNA2_75462_c0_seq1:36-1673(-)